MRDPNETKAPNVASGPTQPETAPPPSAPGSGGGGTPADEAHRRFLDTRTFASLDGLRAIAILVVVWHHAHREIEGWPVTSRGFLGVDLFFVISGFLIVTLILRERRRTGAISLRGFYVRRFLRIFPPYYLMLLIVGGTAALAPGTTSSAILQDLPYALVYVSNLVPMQSLLAISWSLATEEQFYVVVPTLERYAPRVFPLVLPAVYVIVMLPTFGLFPSVNMPGFFRETTFGPILLGVMLAHVLDDPRGHRSALRLLGHWSSPILASALVVIAASNPAKDIAGSPRAAIHWSLLLLVASCVVQERHALRPFLALWPMRRIGAVSYGIYLYHLLVLHFVDKLMKRFAVDSGLVRFVVAAGGTWLVAELSYRYFEARFLLLKSRFAPEGRGSGARVPPVPGAVPP